METKCSICGQKLDGFGNNAWPVNEGRCCDECDAAVVIPMRIRQAGLKVDFRKSAEVDKIEIDLRKIAMSFMADVYGVCEDGSKKQAENDKSEIEDNARKFVANFLRLKFRRISDLAYSLAIMQDVNEKDEIEEKVDYISKSTKSRMLRYASEFLTIDVLKVCFVKYVEVLDEDDFFEILSLFDEVSDKSFAEYLIDIMKG